MNPALRSRLPGPKDQIKLAGVAQEILTFGQFPSRVFRFQNHVLFPDPMPFGSRGVAFDARIKINDRQSRVWGSRLAERLKKRDGIFHLVIYSKQHEAIHAATRQFRIVGAPKIT